MLNARILLTNYQKYDRGLIYARRLGLHWLDVSERLQLDIAVIAVEMYLHQYIRVPL